MGAGWLAGLCLLVVQCQLATAGPTQNPWVVTKDDGETTTLSYEAATEGALPAIKLEQMDVSSLVSLRYARSSVATRVRNPAPRAQETAFRVLLPETAFISGFIMTLENKTYKAYVQEKKGAEKTYLGAVNEGVGAALISTKARDSNHFMVVVNVEANSEAIFNLTYEELLERRNGVYNHAINLHPGAVVPQLKVTVHIKESQKITALRVPAVRTGNEVDATEEDPQNPEATITRGHDDREATITFSPGEEQQLELMKIYADKSKESSDRYQSIDEEESTTGVLGQFVVQYDVARPEGGEVLVSDGYFVHFFSPPELPPLPKHVVFVLDTSGSMEGRKIDQLRTAIKAILGELNEGDYFNLVEFSTRVKVYDLKEAEQPAPQSSLYSYGSEGPVALAPPARAAPPSVAAARTIVDRFRAEGGTNIAQALEVALELVNKGVGWTAEATSGGAGGGGGQGAATTEEPLPKPEKVIRRRSTDVETVNKPEPIIIFLTDGDATVGEREPQRIVDRVVEKNYGDHKASIFSLAFGKDAERTFLRKLSLRNAGFMRHIYEAADAARQLRDFYRQVASPLLANVTFTYPPEQVDASSLTRHKFRLVYGGGEAAAAGRAAPGADVAPLVDGRRGPDVKRSKPKVTKLTANNYLPLERVWAYMTVRELLDKRDAFNDDAAAKQALAIALKYEFVTPLTSLVVVKPNATSAVDLQSVDDPTAEFSSGQLSRLLPTRNILRLSRPSYSRVKELRASKSPLTGLPEPPALFAAQYGPIYEDRVSFYQPLMAQAQYQPLALLPAAYSQFDGGAGAAGLAGPAGAAGGFVSPMFSADQFQVEDEKLLIESDVVPASTTPAPQPAAASPLLSLFQLEEYPWTEPLIDLAGGALRFSANGAEVVLKLTRQPESLERGTQPCARAAGGAGAGACVYLTQCARARSLGAQGYAAAHCRLPGAGGEALAGVCCPSIESEIQKD